MREQHHRTSGMCGGGVREDKDPTRRTLIASLTKQVLQSPNRAALMKELFPEDGKRCTPTTEEAKMAVKEIGNVEALDLLELTDTVQCVQLPYTCDFWARLLSMWTCPQRRNIPTHSSRSRSSTSSSRSLTPSQRRPSCFERVPEEGVGTGSRKSNKREEERKIRVDALKRQVVDRSCNDGSRMSHIEHHRWQLDGLKKPLEKLLN